MIDSLFQHFPDNPFGAAVGAILMVLVFAFFELLPVCALVYLFHFLLTLPMRRNERARLFLDLLELGIKDGRTPEAAIVEASASRDHSIGARFHLLAVHIQKGLRLSQALEQVPRLLPFQIRGMLKAGERMGSVAKILPACRQLLRDGVSQVRGALNYLIVLAFCVTPFTVVIPVVLNVYVMPKFKEVFAGMTVGMSMPAFSQFVFTQNAVLVGVQVAVLSLVWLATIAYLGGPRLHGWLQRRLPGITDETLYRLPWRRKRLQRDFSAMLAVLLDAEMPEAEAVMVAAQSTGNTVLIRRAQKVCALLANGVKLSEAIRAIDDSGELHWRISNALHQRGGFLRALAGWHEALDAKAFQLEQTAAQVMSTGFVLFNGVVVGCIVIAVFLMLINLLNQATLW
jgi:type II secretory pathway component PulF